MQKYTRIGVDLGKNYFQIHALPDSGAPVSRKLKRSKLLEFFSQIAPCEIGMEACGSATIGRASLNVSDIGSC